MVETSQTHRAELEHVPSAADFADAISDDPASAGLLSESEVESLLRGHAAMETVSKEQAQSDVSLLFRALQSAYGAYEYFGQEKFDAAEDAVTQWLSSQDDEIKVSALGEKLQESLAFMLAHDAHAVIYEPAAEEIEAQVRYEYFFADGFYFSKDVNCSYYMLRKDAGQSSVTLKNSSGKAKIYRLDWTESQPLDVDLGTLDYRLIQEDGLTYVSLRSFVSGTYDNMLARYAREGAKARGSKAVIYDLRGNVGRESGYRVSSERRTVLRPPCCMRRKTAPFLLRKTARVCCRKMRELALPVKSTGPGMKMIFRSSCWLTIIAARPARVRYSF